MATFAAAQAAEVDLPQSPKPAVLWAIALAGSVGAACSFAVALTSEAVSGELGEPLVIALLSNWLSLSYVLCGLLAWSRRPASRFGPLMVAAGFVNVLETLSWTSIDVTFTVGHLLDLVPPVLFLHVFLAFPTGRLEGRFERAVIVAAYTTAVGLQLVRMAFGEFGPHNLLEVAPAPEAALLAVRIQVLAISAFCLTGVGILVARRRRGGRPLRRSLALLVDAFALGLVMIAAFLVSQIVNGPAIQQLRWATWATVSLAPVAFLIGVLHDRLARSSVGELLLVLRTDPAPAELRDGLARTLRDPSLTLAYWLPDFATYADLDGRPVELPAEDERRATTLIDRDGAHVAALLHDPALNDEPQLLDAVTAAAGIAIENARLQAELAARLEEVKGSRIRVIEAGESERKRLERDLHDGAQQRLIALSLELKRLEREVASDPGRRRLDEAQHEITRSLEELRAVARGLHPAVLTGHGLGVALEQVAARAPVPVRLSVEIEGRLPEQVEIAGYYVVTESLTNVAKHAQARSASVDIARHGDDVIVEIVDDGIGGADSELGSGLRGLADRVEALGGSLRVWTPHGGGTRVRAEIPCA